MNFKSTRLVSLWTFDKSESSIQFDLAVRPLKSCWHWLPDTWSSIELPTLNNCWDHWRCPNFTTSILQAS